MKGARIGQRLTQESACRRRFWLSAVVARWPGSFTVVESVIQRGSVRGRAGRRGVSARTRRSSGPRRECTTMNGRGDGCFATGFCTPFATAFAPLRAPGLLVWYSIAT